MICSPCYKLGGKGLIGETIMKFIITSFKNKDKDQINWMARGDKLL